MSFDFNTRSNVGSYSDFITSIVPGFSGGVATLIGYQLAKESANALTASKVEASENTIRLIGRGPREADEVTPAAGNIKVNVGCRRSESNIDPDRRRQTDA